MIERPKLRPVEIVLARASDRPVYLIRDASHTTDGAVTVSEDILYVLRFFDGQHSALDIRAEYMRKFGSFLFEEQLDELVQKLDTSLLLESDGFTKYMEALKSEFARSEIRTASHAGSAYPGDPEELCETFDGFFAHPDGPGEPSSVGAEGAPLRGVVLPHIDMRAGGPCLAWGYKALAEREWPEIYVILGTGHSNPENNFALTMKDFVTPLGRARTDRSFVESLLQSCGPDLMAGELAHKSEHSVEFQVVFLQYLYGKFKKGASPSIVPVLCSFGHANVDPDVDSQTAGQILEFVGALRDAIEASGRTVCLLASADLAHLGPRYGDQKGVEAPELGLVRNKDIEMLGAVERGDAEEFASYVAAERDARRVCGFSPIYTLLKTLEPTSGKLLKYSYTPVDNAGSIVSFASVALE